jgi:acyl carrier protein
MEARITDLFVEIFNVHPSEVDGGQKITDLEEWDSLKHTEFVLGLEAEFGFELTGEEIADLLTIDDVHRVVYARSEGVPL